MAPEQAPQLLIHERGQAPTSALPSLLSKKNKDLIAQGLFAALRAVSIQTLLPPRSTFSQGASPIAALAMNRTFRARLCAPARTARGKLTNLGGYIWWREFRCGDFGCCAAQRIVRFGWIPEISGPTAVGQLRTLKLASPRTSASGGKRNGCFRVGRGGKQRFVQATRSSACALFQSS